MTIAGHISTTLLPIAPTLGDGAMLVSPWKPLVLLVTLAAWAWVISTIYDKHAARFFLPRKAWNLAHCSVGLIALAAALLIPLPGEGSFYIGWGVMIVLLVLDLVVYAMVANKDERVPEDFKIRLDILTRMAASRDEKKKAKQLGTVKLAVRKPDKSLIAAPDAESPEFEVRTEAEKVFLEAIAARASQVDLAMASKDGYGVSHLIDGVRSSGGTLPVPLAVKVIDFWKSAATLDVNDRRRKLTGDTTIEQGASKTIVRLTSVGDRNGMRLSMLFDPAKAVNRKPEGLGLLTDQMADLKALVADGKGLVILAGMPDTGRTTTMYSVLQLHDAYTSSIQTLETEPQMILEGIRHQAFDPGAEGADFGTTVRSLLRRDPDVLSVSDLIDAGTAKEVAKADFDRTRVYIGVRADNALAAVETFLKTLDDNALAAKGLRGVVCQKLMRKLCTNCRVNYPPTADMLKKMGVSDASKVPTLFKKGGQVLIKNKPEVCPACAGVGFVGQEAIFEVYRFDEEDRAAIADGNLSALKANLKKRAVKSMQQAALIKAIAGVTSVEEVMRVTTAPSAPSATASAAPAAKPAAPSAPPAQAAS
ncbi:MAG: ATPase, T2SS/T4P/T4SS family [Phycisphaerales bacterium]